MLISLCRRYLRPYRGAVVMIIALQLIGTGIMLWLPSLNADIVDRGVAVGDVGYISRTGLIMLGLSFVLVLVSIAAVYFAARTSIGFGRDVRAAFLRRANRFSALEIDRIGAPSLITRNTNDVQQIQMLLLMGFSIVVTAPIMGVGGVIMALRIDLVTSTILVIAVPLLAIVMGILIAIMVPAFRTMQTRIDGVNRTLREQITGIRVVRAFVRERTETDRFQGASDALTDTALFVGRMNALMMPAVMLIANATSVAVLWFGGHRIADGDMQIGGLSALLTYIMQILMGVIMTSAIAILVPRASVCAERVLEVLDAGETVTSPGRPVTSVPPLPSVRFRGVGYRFPGADEPVFSGVDLDLEPGTTTAIIGGTGSGKTTLLRLIPRLMDATSGRVTLGGIDVRRYDPDLLRSRIGLVPQKAFLFSGTIADNLRFGRENATDAELWHALEVAQAADFVRKTAEGLDAPVAQGGTNFSGGQRQRLAIARALVRRPSIYLFDDSFSALDTATDSRLRHALAGETRQSIVLLVGQRVATVRDADTIIVLEQGEVVGRGTHAELLATCPTYVEIVESQAMVAS